MRLILFKPDTYIDVDAVEAILPAQIPGMSRVLLRCGKEVRVELAPLQIADVIRQARARERD